MLVDCCFSTDPIYQIIVGGGLLVPGETWQLSVMGTPTSTVITLLSINNPFFKSCTLVTGTEIVGHLRFYAGIENLFLPMLSYPGCQGGLLNGCFKTYAHDRQGTSLLC